MEVLYETAVGARIDKEGIHMCTEVLISSPESAALNDFKGCCAFVARLPIDFHKIKKFRMTIAGVIRCGWDKEAALIALEEGNRGILKYIERKANQAYDI